MLLFRNQIVHLWMLGAFPSRSLHLSSTTFLQLSYFLLLFSLSWVIGVEMAHFDISWLIVLLLLLPSCKKKNFPIIISRSVPFHHSTICLLSSKQKTRNSNSPAILTLVVQQLSQTQHHHTHLPNRFETTRAANRYTYPSLPSSLTNTLTLPPPFPPFPPITSKQTAPTTPGPRGSEPKQATTSRQLPPPPHFSRRPFFARNLARGQNRLQGGRAGLLIRRAGGGVEAGLQMKLGQRGGGRYYQWEEEEESSKRRPARLCIHSFFSP